MDINKIADKQGSHISRTHQPYMKHVLPSTLLFLLITIVFAKDGITFKVEDLKKPTTLLEQKYYDDIIKGMLLADNFIFPQESLKIANLPYGIIAKSKNIDSLVSYGYHPFFDGMYQAYAEHRPFTLSPDMIWLLLCQGFANHVNINAEELRGLFVNFTGKRTLVVNDARIDLNNPESPWEQVFPDFAKQISDNVGKDIVDVLTCNFSTTTSVERIASEVTIMETFKSYFEYLLIGAICGIPEITLKGTPQDWQKVYEKAQALKKYKLDWWIDELDPVFLEFINASKGNINKTFWRNMFKYHSLEKYGAPKVIDGWIVKFYPYDKEGKRLKLKEIYQSSAKLPNELVKTDVGFLQVPLEIWAGFFGLKQDPSNFNLTPKIGWMIRKKNKNITPEISKNWLNISIRVKEFPQDFLDIPYIKMLRIIYLDTINVPVEIKRMKIGFLILDGKLAPEKADEIIWILSDKNFCIRTDKYSIKKDYRYPKDQPPVYEDTRFSNANRMRWYNRIILFVKSFFIKEKSRSEEVQGIR
jgi:hypothetical protein